MSDEKSKKIPTEPYKGVRDFYPEDQSIQNYLFDTMRRSARAFGYQEYSASPLEPSELYFGKTSEEIVNEQTYTFTDRGGRSVTLRPEMTPTVARMIASRRKSLAFPVRLFSISNVFRYERPQKGRLREHYQLNIDLFGISGIEAEIEIIEIIHDILSSFGLTQKQFEVRVNDRMALNALLSHYNLSEEAMVNVVRLLDKKSKISDFDEKLRELIGTTIDFEQAHSNAVEMLIGELKTRGITNVVYDKTLARGFDYYTGIVFEVFDTNPNNPRSIFGGGRYDNLLSMFDEEPIPTVGFGMGDVVIRDVLESYNLLPNIQSYTDVYVVTQRSEDRVLSGSLAKKLRDAGYSVTTDLKFDSIGNQLKRASQQGALWAVILGENEVAHETVTLKHLKSGEQYELPETHILKKIAEE